MTEIEQLRAAVEELQVYRNIVAKLEERVPRLEAFGQARTLSGFAEAMSANESLHGHRDPPIDGTLHA